MKVLLSFFIIFACSFASAKTLTYKADFSQMSEVDATSLDICGYPAEFKLDAKSPLGPTFITKMITGDKVSSERIQATTGAVSGGQNDQAYQGEYREKVYIVKQVLKDVYQPGIYVRVQINTYGSPLAPSGFVVNSELLNHRYSAELAEGAFCGDIFYKLSR